MSETLRGRNDWCKQVSVTRKFDKEFLKRHMREVCREHRPELSDEQVECFAKTISDVAMHIQQETERRVLLDLPMPSRN